jgi:hypothetical protein
MMAVSPAGDVEGYLIYGLDDEKSQGREVAADNWQAHLALLRYHALLFDEDSIPTNLQYFLPLDSPLTHWLIDTLEVPDTSHWRSPAEEWGVRSTMYHHRFTGWMSSLTDFPLLLASMLPELRARWQRALAHWDGEIAVSVEGLTRVLRLSGNRVDVLEQATSTPHSLVLSPQALIQLAFGYRHVQELADISSLPDNVRSALAILFPPGHTWIPRTDWF